MNTITCTVCGAGFDAARSDAKYCSPKCRQTASRSDQEKISVSDGPAPEEPVYPYNPWNLTQKDCGPGVLQEDGSRKVVKIGKEAKE